MARGSVARDRKKELNTYTQLPARYQLLAASNPGSILLQTARFDEENEELCSEDCKGKV